MTLRRRVTSALVVFGVGAIASMPFLQRPELQTSATSQNPLTTDASPSPTVALRIPVETPRIHPIEPDMAERVIEQQPLDQPMPKKIRSEMKVAALPSFSHDFPEVSQRVPPATAPLNQNAAIVPSSAARSDNADQTSDQDAPRVYKIRDGDTLHGIARKLLKNAERWSEILSANRDVITDPDILPVGKEIRIPPRTALGNSSSAAQHNRAVTESRLPDPSLTPLVPIP